MLHVDDIFSIPVRDKPVNKFRRLTLAQQYAWAGSIVLIVGMLTIGSWVHDKIKHGVIQNSAAATALYMDSMIAPQVQQLADDELLTPEARREIGALFKGTNLGSRVVSVKIWKQGGLIVYATNAALIGQRFVPTDNLKNAWNGKISAEFENLDDAEDADERAMRLPLLEMYVPIRKKGTDQVIAVAEFYATGEEIRRALDTAFQQTWVFVGLTSLIMLGTLYGIVRSGSGTIEAQRSSLEVQVRQLTDLLKQNERLRIQVQQASQRSTKINERFLRKIGADLHDGPAQLIGLALLRMDQPAAIEASDANGTDIRQVLKDALKEIRDLSAGLALPELQKTGINDGLLLAIRNHEKRTNTQVRVDLELCTYDVAHEIVVCAYRFVQEGLNNAFRHAGGKGQAVRARFGERDFELSVADGGLGIDPRHVDVGIGLVALRNRILSLGGQFDVARAPAGGTLLTLRFPRRKVEDIDG